MSKVDKDTVHKLAKLALLKLSTEEVNQFADEFSEILTYVEQLSEANTDGLEPTYQVNGLASVTRPDEPIDYGTSPDDLLKNVPSTNGNYIETKRMLG